MPIMHFSFSLGYTSPQKSISLRLSFPSLTQALFNLFQGIRDAFSTSFHKYVIQMSRNKEPLTNMTKLLIFFSSKGLFKHETEADSPGRSERTINTNAWCSKLPKRKRKMISETWTNPGYHCLRNEKANPETLHSRTTYNRQRHNPRLSGRGLTRQKGLPGFQI